MGKIVQEFETQYDKGDVVIFKKGEQLRVGIIESYGEDDGYVWYAVRTGVNAVYSYSQGGDIPEWDIVDALPADIASPVAKILKQIEGDTVYIDD